MDSASRTRDRKTAEARAKEIARALAEERLIGVRPGNVTLGQVYTGVQR